MKHKTDWEENKMDHLEMVEKLREKANVSYEEASAALEKCNWDLLDALLMLEGQGRLQDDKAQAKQEYTTRAESKEEPRATRKKREQGVIAHLLHGVAGVLQKCSAVSVEVKKNGEVRLTLPLLAVIVLVIFMFWWIIAAAVIAMLFGYRYAIKGLTIDADVNKAMDKAGEFVDNVVKPDVRVVVDGEEKADETKQNDAQ